MGSIPPNKLARDLANAARDVAFELRLPWRLLDLRKKALEVYQRPAANSGRPSEEAHETKLQRVRTDVRRFAGTLERLEFGVKKPTSESIDLALNDFTLEQWETLIEDLGQEEIELLIRYIDSTATEESRARYERLKRKIGAKHLHAILGIVVQRDLELWSENERPMTVPITDPYWDEVWSESASRANRKNEGRTAEGGSIAEAASERSTTRRLNKSRSTDRVNPGQVGTWRKKRQSLTFEQYFADKLANEEYDPELDDEQKRAIAFIEYYALIRKKYLHWPPK